MPRLPSCSIRYSASIQRYAAFVHLLPASESHHHRGAGGLFRHGLEVAFWAAQASESVIFSIEGTPRERRDNEPRWRLASCFSGLLHDVGKPLSDVSITDKDGSITWNPYSESLHDWAHRHEIDRYFIRWRDKRHKRHEQLIKWASPINVSSGKTHSPKKSPIQVIPCHQQCAKNRQCSSGTNET